MYTSLAFTHRGLPCLCVFDRIGTDTGNVEDSEGRFMIGANLLMV